MDVEGAAWEPVFELHEATSAITASVERIRHWSQFILGPSASRGRQCGQNG
jgi:hypothetical protein